MSTNGPRNVDALPLKVLKKPLNLFKKNEWEPWCVYCQ